MQTMIDFNPLLFKVAKTKIHYSTKVKPKDRLKITSSKDAHNIFLAFWKYQGSLEHYESFKALLLNRTNKVLGIADISEGGISGTVVDPRLIFQHAILANASAIILAHNHPSGNIQPSGADKKLTTKLKEAGIFLEIPVLDHIILTPDDNYFSFADERLL